jgi:hypothetical protein
MLFGFDFSAFFQGFNFLRGQFEFLEKIFDILLVFGYSYSPLIDICRDMLLDFTGVVFGDGLSILAKDLVSEGRKVAIKENFLVDLFLVDELIIFGFHLFELFSGRFDTKDTGIMTRIWTVVYRCCMAGLEFLVEF